MINIHRLFRISRQTWIWSMVLCVCISCGGGAQAEGLQKGKSKQKQKQLVAKKPIFEFDKVVERARSLAKSPYQPPKNMVPTWLLEITYDQLRDIRFFPEKSHWRQEGLPFELQFFHPGLYFDRTVKINEITDDAVVPIKFSVDLFNYEKTARELKEKIPPTLGFAGFRIHGNINTPNYKDEIAVFLGASYFKSLAKGQVYGLSARGLAIDTAHPKGEEFPWFREFWIRRPKPDDTQITVYALLDSERATGAYRFIVTPGIKTVMDVDCTIFLRKEVDKLGIAPLTSMFFYGENTNNRPKDSFRPEVHDSDGLMIEMETGEWIWRPVRNPTLLQVNAFEADNVRGFGLMQRDLNFDHYQDLEAHYQKRPSAWITTKGAWGKGWVELVQIPTDDEIHDNIVAFWRPASVPINQPVSYSYSISWQYPDQQHPPGGRVVATRTETWKLSGGRKKYIVDFEGPELAKLQPGDPVDADVTVSPEARIVEKQVYKNTETGGWRLVFQVQPETNPSLTEKLIPERRPMVEIRAFLRHGFNILTETWSYASQL
ncbi:MAG: glucan biosynthesis protein [Desulfobacterota bacterium]|nr:glucan biosynthesis protein [Thermodesulfobacteriota bacterium]